MPSPKPSIIFGQSVRIGSKPTKISEIDRQLSQMLNPIPKDINPIDRVNKIFKLTGHHDTDQTPTDYKRIGADGCLYVAPNLAIIQAHRIGHSIEFYTSPQSRIVCWFTGGVNDPFRWYHLANGYQGFHVTQHRFYILSDDKEHMMLSDQRLSSRVEDDKLLGLYEKRANGIFVVEAAK